MIDFNHSMIVARRDVNSWTCAYRDHDGHLHSESAGFVTLYKAICQAEREANEIYYGAFSCRDHGNFQEAYPEKYRNHDQVTYHIDGTPSIYIDYLNRWLSLEKDHREVISIMVQNASHEGARGAHRIWIMFGSILAIGLIISAIINQLSN
ncbi:hypothetical protein [Litoreibacter roseus]|uniref:Uncharacterized protein n=1 Tax=Litoreibacter roseus TaxID=2601869 RepID=A0A6N6JCQ3_9RHOB|nr:hypothetical protein [Litoreibacter roseus]GFE62982.1 hypothetical protein KIN_00560 [Litoreibacter roseus]